MSSKVFNNFAIGSLLLVFLAMQANCHEQLVSDICLRCICESLTGCNLAKVCDHVACGLFHITRGYWAHAGKPTIEGESSESSTAYSNCANDPYCAAETIQNYMKAFGRDCNGDNQINCHDYAAIHQLGPYGCQDGIYGPFAFKLNQCLRANGQ
ncbi:lysozyme-like [Eupeodes corollae]|uniref:lysozyme-like n=1 Tax=Eupeodes corollae TaxID=290404 RepID=UPI0024922A57|nr:lysozyme-like [Eupeodes corollae]